MDLFQTFKVVSSDLTGSEGGPYHFGDSVDLSLDLSIYGIPYNDDGDSGSAEVWRRTAPGALSWELDAQLLSGDPAANGHFGVGVALALTSENKQIAVVGADGADAGAGAAYVFERLAPGTWTPVQKLVASDAQPTYGFGSSVAAAGDTIVVGAALDGEFFPGAGAAYVFKRSGATWAEVQKLTLPTPAAADLFGRSVAVNDDENRIVVGAPGFGATNRGSASIFELDGTWSHTIQLLPGAISNHLFGRSVAISVNGLVVGAPTNGGPGAAYVYVPTNPASPSWNSLYFNQLTPSTSATDDQFGWSVDMWGERIIVGQPSVNRSYIFVRNPGTANWVEMTRPLPTVAAFDDKFGQAVAIFRASALVSAPTASDTRYGCGFYYEFGEVPIVACFVQPECVAIGEEVTVRASYQDDTSGGHRAVVGWEAPDNSQNEEVEAQPTGTPGYGTVVATHRYPTEGTKSVTVGVIDSDGLTGVGMCGEVKVVSCAQLVCDLIEQLRTACTLDACTGARLRAILVSAKRELERACDEREHRHCEPYRPGYRHRARDRVLEFLRELKRVMACSFRASGVAATDIEAGKFGVYDPECVRATRLSETSAARRRHQRPQCPCRRECNTVVSPKDANALIAAAIRIRRCLDYAIEYYDSECVARPN